MKTTVDISTTPPNDETLKEGDLVMSRSNADGSIYIIIQINEHTFNLFSFSRPKEVVCLPKTSVSPFYGKISVTSERS